jgi:hypothetical protein
VSKPRDWTPQQWVREIRARCHAVDGCWVWQGAVTRHGAPRWQFERGVEVGVHRQAWRLLVGAIAPGAVLVNTCGEPRCCRPAHWVCLTRREHALRELAAGRGTRGTLMGLAVSRSWRSRPDLKMNAARAAAMRERRATVPGLTLKALAAEFGVSKSTAWLVVSGQRWHGPTPFDGLRGRA